MSYENQTLHKNSINNIDTQINSSDNKYTQVYELREKSSQIKVK